MYRHITSIPAQPHPALLQARPAARRLVAGLLWPALCAVFGVVPGAFADSTWTNTGSGSWTEAANWVGGVPGSNDNAEINNGGTARLGAGVSTSAFSVRLGALVSGGSGSLEIAGGNLSSYSGYLAYSLGSSGSATVSGGGSWINSNALYVGYFGAATLLIDGSIVRNSFGSIAHTPYSAATVTLNSGTWINSSPLSIGTSGTGTLLVNGGLVQNTTGTIGANGYGIATVSSGSWVNSGTLFVGTSGTASLTVQGGLVQNTTGQIGLNAGSLGSVAVSSGTWKNTSFINVGYSGTGSLTITGGLVQNTSSSIGNDLGSRGTVTISSGTWQNDSGLTVGTAGTGTLVINGGLVKNDTAWIANGSSSKSGVTVTSGTWMNTNDLYLGFGGSGTLTVSGGLVQSRHTSMGVSTGTGTALVTGGTWVHTGSTTVGSGGRGSTITIQSGGTVLTGGSALIGDGSASFPTSGSGNGVRVSGDGSTWRISDSLIVGRYGSSNHLTVTDGGLAQIGNSADDTLRFSTQGSSANNFLRVDEGYVALFGNQVDEFEALIAGGVVQIWNGSTWTVSTNPEFFTITYFTTNEEGLAETGYGNLGGYTVLTAIPEPSVLALVGVGVAGGVMGRRRRR